MFTMLMTRDQQRQAGEGNALHGQPLSLGHWFRWSLKDAMEAFMREDLNCISTTIESSDLIPD